MSLVFDFSDVDKACESDYYSVAVSDIYNLLQKALHFYLANALSYLAYGYKFTIIYAEGCHPDIMECQRKHKFEGAAFYSRLFHKENISLSNCAITQAFAMNLISEKEYKEIQQIKDFRDKRVAHNLFFNKQVLAGEISKTDVKEIIDLAKNSILQINKRMNKIAKEDLTEAMNRFGKDSSEVLNNHTSDKLIQIIRENE